MKRKESNPQLIRQIDREAQKRKLFRNSAYVKDMSQDKQAKIREKSAVSSNVDIETLINSFHSDIKSGPEYICTCCDQLWYKSSVT